MRYNLMITLLVSFAYFLYHYAFLSFSGKVFSSTKKHQLAIFVTFVLNYIWCIIASIQNLHLIINWTVIFLLFLAELLLIYQKSFRYSLLVAYLGIIHGLAWNILFRCLAAIAWNKPMSAFDNHMDIPGNVKRWPVLLGFAVTGIIFFWMKKKCRYEKVQRIFRDPASVRFYIGMQTLAYIYLALNMLGYYVKDNSDFLKLWGIKSSLFAVMGMQLCGIYAEKMSQIRIYQKKMEEHRAAVLETRKDKTWTLAYEDILTGCGNRYLAQNIIEKYWEERRVFYLCFVDADGLKVVNDRLGHQAGDQYLKIIADVLKTVAGETEDVVFRYGGDEFLVILPQEEQDLVEAFTEEVETSLKGRNDVQKWEFSMSVSIGIAHSSEADTIENLIKLADERMYCIKKQKNVVRRSA